MKSPHMKNLSRTILVGVAVAAAIAPIALPAQQSKPVG